MNLKFGFANFEEDLYDNDSFMCKQTQKKY